MPEPVIRGSLVSVDAVQALVQLGGVSDSASIVVLSSRRKLRSAVARGEIIRVARDRYLMPQVEVGAAAARLRGVISHLSAAQHWEWAVKASPARPHVAVPRGRNLAASRRIGVVVHHLTLSDDEVVGVVTSPLRTLIDCSRALPFDEALAVADSALRSRRVTALEFQEAAAGLRGVGSDAVRRVAAHADPRAANPFESVTRAIALECGLSVDLQVPIVLGEVTVHPDLVDRSRRLVIEADSWGFHASKDAHDRDCWRYTMLVTQQWHVLRFTWAQVMRRPEMVREVLSTWARRPPESTEVSKTD